jgi:hypothetical protein
VKHVNVVIRVSSKVKAFVLFFFPFTKQTETPDAGQVTCVKEK